jgi:site-specific DNA-methyltransferase (adenine-specific)
MELNKIYNIDCIVGFKKIKSKSVDLVLTDIPYTVVNRRSNGLRILTKEDADIGTFNLNVFLKETVRVCRGSIYIFCGTEQVSFIRKFLVDAGLSTRLIIWEKSNPSPMNGEYIWLSGIEVCVFGKFQGASFNEKCKNSVLKFPSGRSKSHPTEKPLRLFKYLVEVSSNQGDTVLDPCIGSGTTAIACLESKRKYLGFEINTEYYNHCVKRIEGWKEKNPILNSIFEKEFSE